MKEHFQDYGARKWAGDDLIELQSEPLAALQALVSPYAPCIVSGCETRADDGGGYTVSAGLVALPGKDVKGNDCVKIVRTDSIAMADNNQVCYLTLQHQTLTRTYGDGTSKAIAYNYVAQQTTIKPEDTPYLEIAANGGRRLVDTLGITQKLDREGGDATDVKVTFADPLPKEMEDIASGNKLGALISNIKAWLHRKVDKKENYALSKNDFTDELKEKLKGIDDNANKYTHPSYQAHDSGLYKITVDAKGHVSATTKVTKDDITDLKIPGQDTTYGNATSDKAGLMSAADKSKLDGIAKNANNFTYTHPTGNGNNHIPNGGSSGQYLKYSSYGTAAWAKPASNIATSSAAGFMSAADKTKLDKIDISISGNKLTFTWQSNITATGAVSANLITYTATLSGSSSSSFPGGSLVTQP